MPITLPLAVALLLAGPLATARADTRVYRCDDQGRITYSDVACPGAQVLAFDAGAPAPDAVERLRRDQAQLDARAAARRDALTREAERADAARAFAVPDEDAVAQEAAFGYGAWAPVPGLRRAGHRRIDAHRRLAQPQRSVIPQRLPTPLRAPR